ncbi:MULTISPECIES: DUF4238 domain-containing protein [Bradyrhizobium]|uniref:DUF4238 domain-containing protein n=1 Tax=Bradyrhizobium TaxID=374 RepID=UPI001EDB9362|nr:DUF4238 domain-containing protein [Bradyrhizobium zhengyangense]MCG2639412.1 DUF4238 domain-containing protein [Bradyrhizobium zhengyangense]
MSISNNKPRDHHYIPVFYLKQWRGQNKKLIEYTIKHGKLIAKPVGPKGTGFQTDLYAFPELPPDMTQHIEDVFLKYADNTASNAIQMHLTGQDIWTAELRSGWSRFLISLIIRHPDVMVDLRTATVKSWKDTEASTQAEYEKTKESHYPATFDEYIAAIDPLIPVKVSLNAIIKAFDNEKLGKHINDMHWSVIDLSKGVHRLLTSDRPLQYMNLANSQGFIALPISPTKLFLAANSPQSIMNVRSQKSEKVIREVNLFVVSRARRFVFAQDESQTIFIKKRIHTAMESAPIP